MIIVCPDCSAKFVVKAEMIGTKGRKVKCAKCKKDWFQEPDPAALEAAKDATPEPAATEPVKEGANVPAVKDAGTPLPIKIAFAASIIIMIFTISLTSAHSILPSMSGYYSIFGIYDTREIALYDIKVEKIEAGKYQDLLVLGKIVNESEVVKHLPDLKIAIYNDEGDVLKSINLASDGAEIAGGEVIDFENRIPRLPKLSDKVVMDIGGSL